MLTHGVHEGRITLERLVQVCCENPARIYGLFPRKGTVAVGSDADLVVIDLSREVTVGPEHLNTRAGRSIMEDKTYHGWPVLTLLGGRVVAEWAAGWGRPAGLGRRPVLLIDVDYNFVVDRPGRVLERARARRLPVLYTTSPRRPDGFDLCVWNLKSWRAGDGTDVQGHLGNEIVAEVAPHPGDLLVERKPSAFLGTPLVSYLVALPADTVLLCGTTTSGCVRASAVDPSSYDFRVGIPEPCVWDRGELTHAELPGLREGGSAAR
jgi:nicotinamidase-related amidase